MLKLVRIAFGFITGNRDYLTLLLVAGAAAWLYAQWAGALHERDAVIATADQICAAAGSALQPEGARKKDRGVQCRATVTRLAAFQRESAARTAETLIRSMKDRDARQSADIALTARAAADAREAAKRMEKADENVPPDNHVGPDWFAALNRAGGLRAPSR